MRKGRGFESQDDFSHRHGRTFFRNNVWEIASASLLSGLRETDFVRGSNERECKVELLDLVCLGKLHDSRDGLLPFRTAELRVASRLFGRCFQ